MVKSGVKVWVNGKLHFTKYTVEDRFVPKDKRPKPISRPATKPTPKPAPKLVLQASMSRHDPAHLSLYAKFITVPKHRVAVFGQACVCVRYIPWNKVPDTTQTYPAKHHNTRHYPHLHNSCTTQLLEF